VGEGNVTAQRLGKRKKGRVKPKTHKSCLAKKGRNGKRGTALAGAATRGRERQGRKSPSGGKNSQNWGQGLGVRNSIASSGDEP